MSERAASIALPIIALVCCAALPLALSAGAGALTIVVGGGLPIVVLAAVGAWLIGKRRTGSDRR